MTDFLRTFQAAFIAFTRLPVASSHLCEQHFRHSHYFLPMVGVVIGMLMALAYHLCNLRFTTNTSAVLALFTGILLTGGLHEDGFADCCDGFGGGKDRKNILEIMKDSRLGSFGVLGLIMLIGTKIALLTEIPADKKLFALASFPVAARVTPLLIMFFLPYVAENTSKMTKNLCTHTVPLLIGILFACIYTGLLHSIIFLLYACIGLLLTSWFCQHFFARHLQGYNGDCLGASEQISECMLLLLIAIYYQ